MNDVMLDVDAVRAFVAIADLQSFTRAAGQLGTTQGAVSVKLKRLERRLGQRLIERTPRSVRLSERGKVFVDLARDFLAAHDRAIAGLSLGQRRFSLGIAAHVGGGEISTILTRLNEDDPSLTVEVRVENLSVLLELFDRGKLDAAIVLRDDDRRSGQTLGPEQFGWFATPDFTFRPGEPLRLASSSPSCGMRNIATEALAAAGLTWTESFLGCGSLAVAEAVSAGLATAVFSRRLQPAGTVEVGRKFDLPPLPSSEIVLLSALSDTASRATIHAVVAAFREHRPGYAVEHKILSAAAAPH